MTKVYVVFIGIMLGYPVVILWIQASAFRKLRHKCFALLCASTICVLLYSLGALLPGLLSVPQETATTIFYVSMAPLVLSTIFGIWGTVSLVASYRELAK